MMRVLAVVNEQATGVFTDAGAIRGEATVRRTLSVFNLGAFMGGVGGLFYVLVRRWLPAPSIPRAFAFVILAFLITAGGSLDETNKDFFIFGPPTGCGLLLLALSSIRSGHRVAGESF